MNIYIIIGLTIPLIKTELNKGNKMSSIFNKADIFPLI